MQKDYNVKTLIIIPAYNEESNVGNVIDDIRKQGLALDIVVINDGSADNTAIAAAGKGVEVISHPFNIGYGASLQTGYKYATAEMYDYVVQIDADGQHDARYIAPLLAAVKGGACDIALGSRFLSGETFKSSLPRTIGIFLFRKVASAVLKKRVTDPTSGFQALDRSAVEFCASEEFPADFSDANVLIWLAMAGFRIEEVPVKMHQRAEGDSKYIRGSFHVLYYIFKVFLSIAVTLTRKVEK